MEYGPDFICIGAQKAGTSWLYENLLFHPDTAMPPEKEVNFFYPAVPSLWQRRFFPRFLNSDIQWSVRYRKWKETSRRDNASFPFDWYRQYLFSARSTRQYAKLFPKLDNKISGDISPSYVALTNSQIKTIATEFPHTKIIYLIRHPVERAWSAFRMDNSRFLKNFPTEEAILEHVQRHNGEAICAHSRYHNILNKWNEYAPDRVKVWFYDQLCEKPQALFMDICAFLNITSKTGFDHKKIEKKIFEGTPYKMPQCVRQYLNNALESEILALDNHFHNKYTTNWRMASMPLDG